MIRLFPVIMAVTIISSCSHSYYIVRHAEKQAITRTANAANDDPALSEAGKVRALVLRDELKKKDVRYIYATKTARAVETATPLSKATGIAIQPYSTRDSLNGFIRKLKNTTKGNVLIVGHSNTVDDIVNQFCGTVKIPGDLSESSYDNIFIITVRGKKINFKAHKYGYPSNPD
jgi:broad specificity phosphatase PhoE